MRTQSRTPISILQSAGAGALIFIALVGTAGSAQASEPGLHVEILGIRNSIGAVACALFEGPEGFPTEFLRFATNIMMVKVRATKATCDFADIAPTHMHLRSSMMKIEMANSRQTPWRCLRKDMDVRTMRKAR